MADHAVIRKLTVSRFRGLEALEWRPAEGMNLILGGGDIGKTTILEAVSLLLSPTNAAVISEFDYWQRDTDSEFSIEAVMAMPDDAEINTQKNLNWPWHWNGKDAELPAARDDGDDMPAPDDPVYRVRVRGTSELELVWEIVQPGDQLDHFPVALRRRIGLMRLAAEDRNDRDLRLVYGSALDRLFADTALRSRIQQQVAGIDLTQAVGTESGLKLDALNKRMTRAALPDDLKLGLTMTQGLSIGALIGLLAGHQGVSLPLSGWGAGTRRMAALEIAAVSRRSSSVVTIDEIERGLEPYRLRKLIREIAAEPGQAFVTTHSAVAVECATDAALWYLDGEGHMGALPRTRIENQQKRDPETFLARVAVIGEGPTEVGLLRFLLRTAIKVDPLDYGVRVCNGQGNDAVLGLLETLADSGLRFAALVDDEGRNPERWARLQAALGDRLLQWAQGCTEQRVIEAVGEEKLPALIASEEREGMRLRTLADRLNIEERTLPAIEAAAGETGMTLRALIIAAATGETASAPEGREKEWKSHGRLWFKSDAGGAELAQKLFGLGAWPSLAPALLPLVNATLEAAGLDPVTDLVP